MGFFSNLFKMRSGAKTAEPVPAVPLVQEAAPRASNAADRVNGLTEQIEEAPAPDAIWDTPQPEAATAPSGEASEAAATRNRRNKTRMLGFDTASTPAVGLFEDPEPAPDAPASTADPAPEADSAPAPAPGARGRRNKTRMIGFETSAGETIDFLEPETPTADTLDPTLPVGWMVLTSGPQRGSFVTLKTGVSAIGSGAAYEIDVDPDPSGTTGAAHGSITHDPEDDRFVLTPGTDGAALTLNGADVTATMTLSSGDAICVGTVELRFVALCTGGFRWEAEDNGKGGSHAA